MESAPLGWQSHCTPGTVIISLCSCDNIIMLVEMWCNANFCNFSDKSSNLQCGAWEHETAAPVRLWQLCLISPDRRQYYRVCRGQHSVTLRGSQVNRIIQLYKYEQTEMCEFFLYWQNITQYSCQDLTEFPSNSRLLIYGREKKHKKMKNV